MKVVIFCGGLGVRMGEETKRIPKPMIQIGGKPILWHIMRYYAAWGHNDFILCLGYKGEVIKDYFLSHEGALFNDFTLERDSAGTRLELLPEPADEWRITFVDTGIEATIGGRLKAVESYLEGEDEFLATYGDGLTDARLVDVVQAFHKSGKTAMFLSVQPQFNAHLVETDELGTVIGVSDMSVSAVRINGGFFVFRREILDWIEPGDELVEETFARLIARREVVAFPHDGFFGPMDTIKDQQRLETLHQSGEAPWRHEPPQPTDSPASLEDVNAESVRR
jgi:glucose-1-phosphate cytidylyltransferase